MPLDLEALLSTWSSKKHHFLITTHVRPDPDGLGSQLGVGGGAARPRQAGAARDLQRLAAPLQFHMDPEARHSPLRTLPGTEYRQVDAVIILDTGTWNQLGDFGTFLKTLTVPKVVIDHHISQDDLGATRLVDTSAEATGRLVWEAVQALERTWLDAAGPLTVCSPPWPPTPAGSATRTPRPRPLPWPRNSCGRGLILTTYTIRFTNR